MLEMNSVAEIPLQEKNWQTTIQALDLDALLEKWPHSKYYFSYSLSFKTRLFITFW